MGWWFSHTGQCAQYASPAATSVVPRGRTTSTRPISSSSRAHSTANRSCPGRAVARCGWSAPDTPVLRRRSTAVGSLFTWGRAMVRLLVGFGTLVRVLGLAAGCLRGIRRGATPDAPAGDLIRDDADPVRLVAKRPVVQRQGRHAAQVVGGVQLERAPLDEHAPAGGVGGVDAVDLVADRGATKQAAQLAARIGSEHDGVAVHDVIHRVYLGGAVVDDTDAAHRGRGKQRPAASGADVLEPGSSVDHAHGVSSWGGAFGSIMGAGAAMWAGAKVPRRVP